MSHFTLTSTGSSKHRAMLADQPFFHSQKVDICRLKDGITVVSTVMRCIPTTDKLVHGVHDHCSQWHTYVPQTPVQRNTHPSINAHAYTHILAHMQACHAHTHTIKHSTTSLECLYNYISIEDTKWLTSWLMMWTMDKENLCTVVHGKLLCQQARLKAPIFCTTSRYFSTLYLMVSAIQL